MSKRLFLAATAALFASAPALAQAGNFTLVNAAGADMADVQIRRFGAAEWKPLSAAPRAGARSIVQFSDPDCAFDIRAKVGGTTATWSGVNLCEVKSVTLNRNESGALWVDYD